MISINLTPLQYHEQPTTTPPTTRFYDNNLLYVNTQGTSLTQQTAELAYAFAERNYSGEQAGKQLEELASCVVNAIQPPTRGDRGTPIFHVSGGTPGATVMFQIYGVPLAYIGGMAQAIPILYLNHQRDCIIAIKPDRARIDGVRLQYREATPSLRNYDGSHMTYLTFEHSGTVYRLVYEIVGIGNHARSSGYDLHFWNTAIFGTGVDKKYHIDL